jgi:predicted pyridoxine 5'-phosphate oxidase superfamily flavin-nucleotide-binding protein
MIPDEILRAFDVMCSPDKPLVWIATSGKDGPHLVPVCFIKTLDEKRLIIGNVFIKKTVENLKNDPQIAVAVAFKRDGWDGYLLKGKAEVAAEGEIFEDFKSEVLERSNGKREIKSVVLVHVAKVYSLTPRKGDKRLV